MCQLNGYHLSNENSHYRLCKLKCGGTSGATDSIDRANKSQTIHAEEN
jgi:hypothetical protein